MEIIGLNRPMYSAQNSSRFLLVKSGILGRTLESLIQRKESEFGIPLRIVIRNPKRRVQNPRLSWNTYIGLFGSFMGNRLTVKDLRFLSFNFIKYTKRLFLTER